MKRHTLIKAAGLGCFFAAASVQGATWTGNGDGTSFEEGANWDTGIAPPGATNETYNIDGAFTVDRDVGVNTFNLNVNGGATLNVSAGSHADTRAGNSVRNQIGNGSAGTINLSGASTVYDIGHITIIGNGTSGNGLFNQTDGTFIIGRGGNSFMGITGGSSLEIAPTAGGGSGMYQISGGSLATRIGVGVGNGGTFHVVGSGASSIGIGSSGSLDGSWNQASGGTLRVGVDGGGLTAILIDVTTGTGSGGGNAIFQSGSVLDPYDLGGAAANTWHTVMTWEGSLTDNGLALSTDAVNAGWEMQVDGSNLQVRIVPEPSSAALLGLGGLALILRRRK